MDKYQGGKEISYSLKAHPVEGFDIDFSGDLESGFTVNVKNTTPAIPENVTSSTGDATIPMSSLFVLVVITGVFTLLSRNRKIII